MTYEEIARKTVYDQSLPEWFSGRTLLLHQCSEVMQLVCTTESSMIHFAPCAQLWSGSGLFLIVFSSVQL